MTRAEQKDRTFLEVARILGQLGTCDRKRVGAVIVRGGRCVSWGFNGAPPGLPHCEENLHGYANLVDDPRFGFRDEDGVWHGGPTEADLRREGCRNATHAEANALAFAARQGISTEGCTLYVTVSPCETCARLLIAAGIVRVVYNELYRDTGGVNLLKEAKVVTEGPGEGQQT